MTSYLQSLQIQRTFEVELTTERWCNRDKKYPNAQLQTSKLAVPKKWCASVCTVTYRDSIAYVQFFLLTSDYTTFSEDVVKCSVVRIIRSLVGKCQWELKWCTWPGFEVQAIFLPTSDIQTIDRILELKSGVNKSFHFHKKDKLTSAFSFLRFIEK